MPEPKVLLAFAAVCFAAAIAPGKHILLICPRALAGTAIWLALAERR